MRRLVLTALTALALAACATSPAPPPGELDLASEAPCAPDDDAPKAFVMAIGCVAKIDGGLVSPRAFDAWAVFALPRVLVGAPGAFDHARARVLQTFLDMTLVSMDMAEADFAPAEGELTRELELLHATYDPSGRGRDEFDDLSPQDVRAWEIRMAKLTAFSCRQVECGVTEEESRAFYDQNIDRFHHEEEVRASHVLIKVADGAAPADVAAARAPGADFGELARGHSEDPTASRGGDLGFFTRSRMVKPFSKASFDMKPGEVSEPVRTRFGWHVIFVTDRKPARNDSYAQAREDIARTLGQRKRAEAYEEAVRVARAGRAVEVFLHHVVVNAPAEAPPVDAEE